MRGGSLNPAGLLHLLVVYAVWGSTYLAFRVAVGPLGQFDPYWLGALRFAVAGILLLAYAYWRGFRIGLVATEARLLALTGSLMWLGGNGLLLVASQRADSSYLALLISTTPLWVALLEAGLARKTPSWLLLLSLLGGLAGVAVISWPKLISGHPGESASLLMALGSAMLWAGGTVITQRNPVTLDAVVVSAYQQLFAGIGFVGLALILGHWGNPTLAGWLGYGYLLIFASLLAYTSFVLALRLLPTAIVTTYAYVNPLVAVALGWFFLQEPVGWHTLLGAAMVLMAVGGVFRAKSA